MAKKTISSKVKKGVQEYINILKRDRLPIKKVIVFGSQVKNTAYPDSDIDVCVISSRFKDDFSALHYLLRKSYEVDAPIEPHPFHPKKFISEDPLAWEIKKTGVVV